MQQYTGPSARWGDVVRRAGRCRPWLESRGCYAPLLDVQARNGRPPIAGWMPTAKSLPAKLGFLRAEGLHATNNPQNPSPPTAEYGSWGRASRRRISTMTAWG